MSNESDNGDSLSVPNKYSPDFGRWYAWKGATKACKNGTRLATMEEWVALIKANNGSFINEASKDFKFKVDEIGMQLIFSKFRKKINQKHLPIFPKK